MLISYKITTGNTIAIKVITSAAGIKHSSRPIAIAITYFLHFLRVFRETNCCFAKNKKAKGITNTIPITRQNMPIKLKYMLPDNMGFI
jgi:hypothetical protein